MSFKSTDRVNILFIKYYSFLLFENRCRRSLIICIALILSVFPFQHVKAVTMSIYASSLYTFDATAPDNLGLEFKMYLKEFNGVFVEMYLDRIEGGTLNGLGVPRNFGIIDPYKYLETPSSMIVSDANDFYSVSITSLDITRSGELSFYMNSMTTYATQVFPDVTLNEIRCDSRYCSSFHDNGFGFADGIRIPYLMAPVDTSTTEILDTDYMHFDLVATNDPTKVSTVPVPAAAWLFGSALLGFFGFSRRKANG